tara:strand:+ start:3267 stop:3611 length:345 start_codon:yes stop_codon:yes gene_type:complete
MYHNDNDYDSDNSEDNYCELSEEILLEIEENRKLNVLYNFKQFIQKEPEFTAIENISSFDILSIINSDKKIKDSYMNDEMINFFDDLYIELNGFKGHKDHYVYVCSQIFKKLYV